ncbi:DUF1330 domain-containing protein [Klebsiella aerogenes]
MTAYIVFIRDEMKNQEEYNRYIQEALPTLRQYHGEVIVFNGRSQSIEGPITDGGVILKFKDIESARSWYYSTEYTSIKDIRLNATEGRAVIFEGNE